MNEDDLTKARVEVRLKLEKLFLGNELFAGVIFIGSVAEDQADVFSDLDFFIYSTQGQWTRADMDRLLAGEGLVPSLHYWTGLEKHRLLVNGVRVDIAIMQDTRIEEIEYWPHLFFQSASVIKDVEARIAAAITARNQPGYFDESNDRSAYVLNLFNVAIQFARGEIVNARSRMTGILESRARLMKRLELGSAEWREPTRRVENELRRPLLRQLEEIAFLKSEEDFKGWLITELLDVANWDTVAIDVKENAYLYARRLGDVQPSRISPR